MGRRRNAEKILQERLEDHLLVRPERLAPLAVQKVRYHRPIYWQDPNGEYRVYDLDAAIADTLSQSSIRPQTVVGLGPVMAKEVSQICPNYDSIIARRRAVVDQLNRRAA